MPKVILEVDSFEWRRIRSRDRVALSEDDLRSVLAGLTPEANPLKVEAIELRDYLDGRGQLALRVEIAGAKQDMDDLLTTISAIAISGRFEPVHIERDIDDCKDDDEVRCHRAYVKP